MVAGRALRPIQTSMERQRAFIADASHELRTPLALIRANAEILKREEGRPEKSDIASMDDIISETDRLSSLVSQMLKLARADAGGEPSLAAVVDLRPIAAEAVRQMRLLAEPKNIDVQLTEDGAASVRGDESLLREVFNILLDNSIKYSDNGATVTVDVRNSGDKVVLTVADTGGGISLETLPHVFERFYRADKARSREMGGTGLGLAIAKWIVDSHHGSIRLDSTVGEGTTARVEFPAAKNGAL